MAGLLPIKVGINSHILKQTTWRITGIAPVTKGTALGILYVTNPDGTTKLKEIINLPINDSKFNIDNSEGWIVGTKVDFFYVCI